MLHKVLRWLELPLMGLMLLVSILGSGAFLQFALVLQLGFYALALAGFLLRNSKVLPDSLRIPFYFCLVNAAALKGLVDTLGLPRELDVHAGHLREYHLQAAMPGQAAVIMPESSSRTAWKIRRPLRVGMMPLLRTRPNAVTSSPTSRPPMGRTVDASSYRRTSIRSTP